MSHDNLKLTKITSIHYRVNIPHFAVMFYLETQIYFTIIMPFKSEYFLLLTCSQIHPKKKELKTYGVGLKQLTTEHL